MALRLLVSAQGDPQGRTFRYDFDADRAQILLGRRGGVDVLLPHAAVSLVHARIERRGDEYELVDDGSTNGTLLNGLRLEPGRGAALRQGDKIAIGEFVLEVAVAEGGDDGAGESSISIARRMVAEVMGVLGPGARHPTLRVRGALADERRLEVAEVGRRYVIGRATSCDLVLDDPSVAPEHVSVRRAVGGVAVADLGSQFGLYVNDEFAAGERALRDGDVVSVGRVQLEFADPAEVYLARLEQVPTPEEAPHTTQRTQAPPRAAPARRSELLVVAVAAAVALAAATGLVWLWAS